MQSAIIVYSSITLCRRNPICSSKCKLHLLRNKSQTNFLYILEFLSIRNPIVSSKCKLHLLLNRYFNKTKSTPYIHFLINSMCNLCRSCNNREPTVIIGNKLTITKDIGFKEKILSTNSYHN